MTRLVADFVPQGFWAILNDRVVTLVRLAEGGANVIDPKWCACQSNVFRSGEYAQYRWMRSPTLSWSQSFHPIPIDTVCCDDNLPSGPSRSWTPLALAAAHGKNQVMRYLITRGADVNSMGRGICHCSPSLCDFFSLSILPEFDDRSVPDDYVDEDDIMDNMFTPLHVAICYGNLSSVKILLDHGANPRLMGNHMLLGRTALHAAAIAGKADIAEYLIENKLVAAGDMKRIDFTGRCGLTPLHIAYLYKCHDMVDLLLREGANVNDEVQLQGCNVHDSWTVFAIACARNDLQSALKFLRAGADPEFVLHSPENNVPWTAMGFIYHYKFKLPDDDANGEEATGLRLDIERGIFKALKNKALVEMSRVVNEGCRAVRRGWSQESVA